MLLFAAPLCRGQATSDCDGGLLTYNDGSTAPTISGHPDVQSATISQAGTTQTAVVVDATKFAVNEPMMVKLTGTSMDFSCNTARSDAGASIITGINLGTNTLTLTAPASLTQSAVSGTITPAHEWVAQNISVGGKSRSIFVSFLDHWRFKEDVGAACAKPGNGNSPCPNASTAVFAAKYSSSNCLMATDVYAQLKALNFNGISNNSDGEYDPTGNGACANTKEPYSQEQFPTSWSSVNLGGYNSQPFINTTYGLTVTLTGPKRALLDYFNPNFSSYVQSFLANFNGSFTSFSKSPWFGMATFDDSGNVALTDATWNYHTNGQIGKNDNDPAYQILASAPMQTGNNTNGPIRTDGPARPYLYKDPKVYSKTNDGYNPYGTSAAPPIRTACNITTPCPLAEYLCCSSHGKYISLAAMHAAGWPLYTVMGSSETIHLAETLATGNGATTVFTGTTAGSNITPVSVQLFLTPSGGSPVYFGFGCWNSLNNCGGSAGQAVWKQAGGFVGSTAYPLHYVLTDSNGDIEEVTTAGSTSSSAPAWPAAGSCTGTQTTVSGSVTFTCRGTGIASGNVAISTGVFSLTTTNALASGATITANYTTGGWKAGGTGFSDEDASNTSVFGTNSVCLKTLPDWVASTNYGYAPGQTFEIHNVATGTWQVVVKAGTSGSGSPPSFSTIAGTDITDGTVVWESIGKPVCGTESGSDFGIANMNQTVAADLEGWLSQFAGQYLSSVRTAVKTLAPHMLYQGPDQCGVWFNPCRREIAQAMQQYSDVYYTTLADPSFDPNGTAKYKFITADYSGPIYLYTTYSSTQNAITTANCNLNFPCYSTQAARGQGWYNLLNWSINQASGLNGTSYQIAGMLHWGTHNFQNSPFGLRTDLDNQYDGLEDIVASVSCSTPLGSLTCGGESVSANFLAANGLIATHTYKDANAIWLQAPASTVVPIPAVQMSFNVLPLPTQSPIPTLTKLSPANTYLSSQGFSQDGLSFVPNLSILATGTGFTSSTICTLDGTPLVCTCGSSSLCTITVPAAMMPIPAAATAHSIGISNPVVAVPIVN